MSESIDKNFVNQRNSWNTHLLVVFSILLAFTLDKSFEDLAKSNFDPPQAILIFAVFYILFENWYHLHKDLHIFNITKSSEVLFYLLTTLTFCFLPFIYGKRISQIIIPIDSPDWLMVNFLLILLLDSTRRIITVRKLSSDDDRKLSDPERRLLGEYAFYAITGYAYFVLLLIFFIFLYGASIIMLIKSIIVVGIWGAIRLSDMLIIPIASRYMASIFLNGRTNI